MGDKKIRKIESTDCALSELVETKERLHDELEEKIISHHRQNLEFAVAAERGA